MTMPRHSIDTFSTVLGAIAVALGLLVATGHTDNIALNGATWIGLCVVIIGIGLIPWRRRIHDTPPDH
jgi:membrane protein YdbS with pleckstrin-like domain